MHSGPDTKQQGDDAGAQYIEGATTGRIRFPVNDVATVAENE